jgi:exo-beta-1,3-glucanase (GH17 family)/cellulose synthase/poly-beta-1,6-N-acetylglucosamine synthase-like glycosyltransferase
VLIALVLAAANYALWTWINRPAEAVDVESRVSGFAFNGFQRHQSPLTKAYPSEDELANDLHLLSEHAERVRTYSSSENEALPRLVREAGMRMFAGAWLDRNETRNEAEMSALSRALRGNKNIEAAVVGNETLLRGDLTVKELGRYLKRVRGKFGVPVTTAEPWHIWVRNPELAKQVDFITVHLLPYWEGIPVEAAVDAVFERYKELKQAFPNKRIVIGEVGWPTNGDRVKQAVASVDNAARFVREFLDRVEDMPVDYFLMEAFDQPWKISEEGRAGGYWGMFDAYRDAKYSFEGPVFKDRQWRHKALAASAIALLPMIWFAARFRHFRFSGKFFFCAMIQAAVGLAIWLVGVPLEVYLSRLDWSALAMLIPALLGITFILLVNGFEFTEVLWRRTWRREFKPLEQVPAGHQPFVSIHLPCHNEPPEMVMLTMDSLAGLDYENFEVLVIDNNTKDPAVWRPVEARAEQLGARFRFFHLDDWPGYKAGALNFALGETDPRAEIIGVVDADYVVSRDWLKALVGHFDNDKVAVVQAPQAHRDYEQSAFQRMCNWEFDGFFRIGMHHRNERNAIIQHGTMTLVRRSALVDTGKWSEWCICEDAELGLRLMRAGYETKYVDAVLGRGLCPIDFKAFKSQRFRWAFGAMQILRKHWGSLVKPGPLSAGQRYHFLTGWFSWFADALHLGFVFLSLAWTAGMLADPKHFTLPLDLFLVPVLGFFVAKAAFGPLLYTVRVRCSAADIVGASLASLALSHTIATGVWRGLWAKKGVFVRTAKGGRKTSLLNVFDVVREETLLLTALAVACVAVIETLGTNHREAMLWLAILAAQALPYLAAMVTAAVSARSVAGTHPASSPRPEPASRLAIEVPPPVVPAPVLVPQPARIAVALAAENA